MYDIRETTCEEMRAHADTLFAEHWQEIARNKHVMVLNPDWRSYQALEALGRLLALAAFEDNELVGYSINVITAHLHYADLTICQNDLLFLAQHKRKRSSLGLQLIRRTEKVAKERGARLMLWHAKPDTALAEIMPRLGYGVQDIIFSREV